MNKTSRLRIIGHRGAKGLAPENTIQSIEKAIGLGVDEVEVDVRVTADHIPVLVHDAFVADPSGMRLAVHAHDYRELCGHKADLPTLKQAIEAVGGRVPLQIEIKPHEPLVPIIKVLRTALSNGAPADDLIISSKDFRVLKEVKREMPMLPLVVIERWSGVRASYRCRKLQTNRVSMNQLWLWSGFIRAVRRRGKLLSAYPLNNAKKAAKWQRAGLYGAITDYPDIFTEHTKH